MLGRALTDAVQPDLQLRMPTVDAPNVSNRIGFIRRRLADGDIYFVANTSNERVEVGAKFATAYKAGDAIDPDTGVATKVGVSDFTEMTLAPYESRVFVFGNKEMKQEAPAGVTHEVADLNNGWTVTFTGAGKTEALPRLTDWTADPATEHYSGEAVYRHDFTLAGHNGPVWLAIEGGQVEPGAPNQAPQEHVERGPDGLPNPLVTGTGPGMHAWFEPPVREAALVTVNGQAVGALWHPPYRLDVTEALKPGKNVIEIHVYNTLLNAWSAVSPHDYGPLKAKYGDRFQMQDLGKVKPVSSGLLGTVTLVEEGR